MSRMTRLHPSIPVLLVAALVAFAAPAAAAAKGPSLDEKDDKFVVQNDHVTVWFQGKKPMLHVFPTGQDANATGYGYKFDSLVEFRDLNNDGKPQDNEILGTLKLNSAKAWEVERTTSDRQVVLNLSINDTVKFKSPVADDLELPGDRLARASLVFHLNDAPVTLQADGVTFTVQQTAIKYDLLVQKWPWMDAENGRLALRLDVTGKVDADTEAAVPHATVGGANNTTLGLLGWVATADATYADGTNLTVPVTADIATTENNTRMTFVYGKGGYATLLHDPTIGVASANEETPEGGGVPDSIKDVPAPGLLLAAGAIGLAGMARRRRG